MTKVAKALIYDSTGRVLLLTRSDTHPIFAGEFDLPGGTVENNESYVDSIIREVLEEVGIVIQPEQLTLRFTYNGYLGAERHLYEIFLDTEKPDVMISWEHSDCSWEPIETLLNIDVDTIRDSYIQRVIGHLRDTRSI